MQARATVQVPTEQQIDSLVADVAAIERRIEDMTVGLTRAERMASPKMRRGGAAMVVLLAQVADTFDVALPGLSGADFSANLAFAGRLLPLETATARLAKRVNDTVIHRQGECWRAATAMYTALARVARSNVALATALQPAVAFFAHRKRATAAQEPTPASRAEATAPPTASLACPRWPASPSSATGASAL